MNEEPLSNFVKYKELIDNLTIDSNGLMASIVNAIEVVSHRDNILLNDLNSQSKKIQNEITALNELLTTLKLDVDKTLRDKESKYFNKGYELYELSKDDSPEYIIERFDVHPLTSSDVERKRLVHKISERCTWRHPGMMIRPGVGDWVDLLISLDPLYLVDEHLELLDSTKLKWNSTYQSRIRYSIINENSDSMFKSVPKNQLGFILAIDFFNYKPFDVIKTYITEIYELLKPSGVLIFTYNNCNFSNSVRNFENMLYSYTPGTLIKSMVELIGFEIVDEFSDHNYNLNWLEIKKPGTTNSLRGGQCIAKINV